MCQPGERADCVAGRKSINDSAIRIHDDRNKNQRAVEMAMLMPQLA